MVRIQYMSDLHLERHTDAGKAFAASLDPTGVDVLILAGDITGGPRSHFVQTIAYLCERFAKAQLLYVHGNHELYHNDRSGIKRYMVQLLQKYQNLNWMKRTVVEVKGQRFVGAPLWYQYAPEVMGILPNWADFEYINGLRAFINDEWKEDREFFDKELREGDIAISHFLPSKASVAPRWEGSRTNCFFVTPVDPLILDRKPKLWVHGHTHDSIDTVVGSTRIVCNPYGYRGAELNPQFQDRAVLDA